MEESRELNIGVLLYGCGHHQAAWRMDNSYIEQIGDISYYQHLAQIAERGYFDVVFLQIIKLLMQVMIQRCLRFGLTLSLI